MMLDGTPLSVSIRRVFLIIAVLAAAGAIVSSVSLYHHYGTSQTTYCDFGESFNCDIVNRSTYSTILGVPVALIGIAGYLTLLVLSTFYRITPRPRQDWRLPRCPGWRSHCTLLTLRDLSSRRGVFCVSPRWP